MRRRFLSMRTVMMGILPVTKKVMMTMTVGKILGMGPMAMGIQAKEEGVRGRQLIFNFSFYTLP